jgi:hypothetical protein
VEVHGIELSRAMVARLRAQARRRGCIRVAIGGMATTRWTGTFTLAYRCSTRSPT